MKKFSTCFTILITAVIIVLSALIMKRFEQNTIEKTLERVEKSSGKIVIEEGMQTEKDMQMPWENVKIEECAVVELEEVQWQVIGEICTAHGWTEEIWKCAYYDKKNNQYLCCPQKGEGYVIAFSQGVEGERYSGYLAYDFEDSQEDAELAESLSSRDSEVDDNFKMYVYENLWYAYQLGIETNMYFDSELFDKLYIGNGKLDKETFYQLVEETEWMRDCYMGSYVYRQKSYMELRSDKNSEYILVRYNEGEMDYRSFAILKSK